MESFVWSPAFATGITEVDAQHQELVALINQYGDHVASSPDIRVEDIDQTACRPSPSMPTTTSPKKKP
jgi:hemerythrin